MDAVVRRGQRVAVVALRLEAVPGRWEVIELLSDQPALPGSVGGLDTSPKIGPFGAPPRLPPRAHAVTVSPAGWTFPQTTPDDDALRDSLSF